jgi:hypothetical protein
MTRAWRWAWLVLWLAGAAPAGAGEDGRLVTVSLRDGSTLVGVILEETDAELALRTRLGLELRVPRSAVVSMRPVTEPEAREADRQDPSRTRLLFAPTGRPLDPGEGYLSDHYVVFPGATAGLTRHFSLGGGVSMVPALGIRDQVFYVSPRLAWNLPKQSAVATGVLYTYASGYQAAVAFGVGTIGPPQGSLTLGVGLVAFKDDDGGPWELRRSPLLLVGGSKRLSDRLSLISENWLVLGEDLSSQPFGLGLRFSGGRLSVDVGMILTAEVLREGFPVPWLSFSYHFPAARPAR